MNESQRKNIYHFYATLRPRLIWWLPRSWRINTAVKLLGQYDREVATTLKSHASSSEDPHFAKFMSEVAERVLAEY
jgi:hypothetical protein